MWLSLMYMWILVEAGAFRNRKNSRLGHGTTTRFWDRPDGEKLVGKLTAFFLHNYSQGSYLMPDSDVYQLSSVTGGSFPILVYESLSNRIRVGINPLVLCSAPPASWSADCVVLYHYTSKKAFLNIMSPYSSSPELWAALRKAEVEDEWQGAQWGEGVYCTKKEPCVFQAKENVMQNNYGNRPLGDPKWRKTFKKRAGNADFAVAMVVSRAQAYDVRVESTPEMRGRLLPGFTSKGDAMRSDRDIWVVQVKEKGLTTNVRANVLQQLRRQVATSRQNPKSKNLPHLLSELATLLHAQGKLTEVEPLLREALTARRTTLGDAHPDTLLSINNLAMILRDKGKLDEAEPLFRETLIARRTTLGDAHPNTLTSINNLAGLLYDKGKLDEAELLFREALTAQRTTLGDAHPNTLISINNLAGLLRAKGKLDEAEPLLRETLIAMRTTLGDAHPHTLTSINNLAMLLCAKGKLDEAEPLIRETLTASRTTLGDAHPNTLSFINNLAMLLRAKGKLDEAEPLFREALIARRTTLGDAHPNTLTSINNLATLLHDKGKLDEAEPLYRETLTAMKATLGDAHPNTLTSIKNLDALLREKRKLDNAEPRTPTR